jgi:hypothetical protein
LELEATGRIDLQARKFALVFSVLEGHRRVEGDDMERGIAVARYCGDVVTGLLCRLGGTQASQTDGKLIEFLRDGPKCVTEALRKLKISAEQLHRTARALEQSGLVEMYKTEGEGRHPLMLKLVA